MSRFSQRRAVNAAIAAGLVVVIVAAGLIWWTAKERAQVKFSALFVGSVGIYPGSDVRMLGVKVGAVDSIHPEGAVVSVKMHLDGGKSAMASTGAVIVSPSLVSDRYVQLTDIYTTGAKLADGAVIPQSKTATPVELDQLYNSVIQITSALGPTGANKNGALSNLLNTGAANLGGNGQALNQTIQDFSKATSTLSSSKDNLFSTITNLKAFTSTLANNDAGVASVNSQLASVTQTLADDRQAFSAALTQLSSALAAVEQFVHNNRDLLRKNVDKLAKITQTLVAERASLQQALQSAPLAVSNVISAYDPNRNVLIGRADLNELTLWKDLAAPASSESHTNSAPTLLPATGSGS